MTNQNTEQRNNYSESGERGGVAENLNWGSARSDYGENAYGGRLDEKGMEDSRRGKRWQSYQRGGKRREWGKRGLMTAGGAAVGLAVGIGIGVGIGLAAMYLFDPQQGKNRRETARGKITDASHKAGDFIGKRSRGLRDRARGIMAGTRRKTSDEQTATELSVAAGERSLTSQAG